MEDKSKKRTDPKRYVDARNIPYIVFPRKFFQMNGTGLIGDIGYAVNLKSGEKSHFIVADIGPTNADLGEVSISLAQRLGGRNVNPRNGAGAPRGKILYVVFPYTSRDYKWPLGEEKLINISQTLVENVGGLNSILSCAKP